MCLHIIKPRYLAIVFLSSMLFACHKDTPTSPNGANNEIPSQMPQVDIPWPGLANSPWPMYLHDPQHTGRSALNGPDSGEVIWAADLGGEIFSSPAIGEDGTIYVGVHAPANAIYAVHPDGSIKWRYQTEGTVDSSPLVAADGTIYIGSDDGHLYALDENGNLQWKFATGGFLGYSSPNISKDGKTIYVQVARGVVAGHPAGDDFLYALHSDGMVQWRFCPEAS